ncbi:DUF1700 domain-containing protein [uncultured Nitratireductor sp.]|uniref:DUF1700 domain-containing protein n=1 Tax=uncultured Nitratireductor sp. TaxID=520953 RepID=UPI0025CBCFE1|nr:DUF1700 domain-containing protein [uncultured Nitratireductor sp.]
MTRDAFLQKLKRGLTGLAPEEIEEILADYSAHFAESDAHGRSEVEVAAALGDPARIARELRADIGLRRLETQWSLSNLAVATMALAGLALVDLVVFLPLLVVAIVLAMAFAIVLIAIGAVGLKIVFMALFFDQSQTMPDLFGRLFIGIGFVSGFFGGGALLLMGVSAGIRMFGHYARLHFRAVQPARHDV